MLSKLLQFCWRFVPQENFCRASLKTRLIKEKTDRYDSCKETFRRRAVALQGRLTKQITCIAVFSQKEFLEMPFINPPIITCQKIKAERKFINEEKHRIVFSFQVFSDTQKFLVLRI